MSRRYEYEDYPVKPKRRWKWLLFLLVLFGTAAWFAPVMVAKTGIGQSIVDQATADVRGNVQVGSLSLGWLSPIKLENVVLTDTNGQTVATVAMAKTKKTLWEFIQDRQQLGKVVVAEPRVYLQTFDTGSNVEAVLADLLVAGDGPPTTLTGTVEIHEGTVEIDDVGAGTRWTAERLEAKVAFVSGEATSVTVTVDAKVLPEIQSAQSFHADITWQRPAASAVGNGTIAFRCQSLPVPLVNAVLRRFDTQTKVGGLMTADAQVDFSGDGMYSVAIASLDVSQLAVHAPHYLHGDHLSAVQLTRCGNGSRDQERVKLKNVVVRSDVVNVDANGWFPAKGITSEFLASAAQQAEFHCQGRLDVARLAAQLPNLLKIRDDTQIQSGVVNISFESDTKVGQQQWLCRLGTTSLTAIAAGREITWQKPLSATLRLRQDRGGIVLDQLDLRATFLQATATGNLEEGSATAQADLRQLAFELGQFVDLGGQTFAGAVNLQCGWQRDASQKIVAATEITVRDFVWSPSPETTWREPEWSGRVDAVLPADESSILGVESARATFQAGGEQAVAQLTQPVAAPLAEATWPLDVQWIGNLATWRPRLAALVSMPAEFTGKVSVRGQASCSAAGIAFVTDSCEFLDVKVADKSYAIYEPQVQVTARGQWTKSNGQLLFEDATVASSTVALRGTNVVIVTTGESSLVMGQVNYRGDLARLAGWLHTSPQPPTVEWSGSMVGEVKLTHHEGTTRANWTTDIEDLVVRHRSAPRRLPASPAIAVTARIEEPARQVWREPQLSLAGETAYHSSSGQLRIGSVNVVSQSLQLQASGKLEDLSRSCYVSINGDVAYDLKNIAGLMQAYLGPECYITGAQTRPFTLTGPLFVAAEPSQPDKLTFAFSDLVGQASVGWESAGYLGVHAGQGEMTARISKGIVDFQPLDVIVSNGRLKTTPRLFLTSDPIILSLSQGPLLEEVQISPEMCSQWLMYVAPLVANATRANGTFSLDLLRQADIPLGDVQASTIHGRLTIHSAQIGPGPLAQQTLGLIQDIRSLANGQPLAAVTAPAPEVQWMSVPSQEVTFQMTNGRVYNDGLYLVVGDVTVTTRGSVGLDQSLALLAEIPIRDQWVASSPYLSSLKGQSLRIPVTGTLSRPNLDCDVLGDLTKKVIGNAADTLIQQGINQGLQKLFGPPR